MSTATFFQRCPKMLFEEGQELVKASFKNGNFLDFQSGTMKVKIAALNGFKPAHQFMITLLREMELGGFIAKEMETDPKTLQDLSIPERQFEMHRIYLSSKSFENFNDNSFKSLL